jgi:hypothetical protein
MMVARSSPALWLGVLLLAQLACSTTQAQTAQGLRVTVVVVTHFTADSELQKDPFAPLAAAAATRVEKHFFDYFGLHPKIIQDADDTSRERLQTLLRDDLRNDSSQSLHVVFFLSHGWSEEMPPPGSGTEFYFATSDTQLKKSSSAMSGRDLLSSLFSLAPGASVFLIVDACSSAAIDTDLIRKELSLLSEGVRVRTVVLASSLVDNPSFAARLTNALVNVWEAKGRELHCGKEVIESFLDGQLISLNHNTGVLEQHVRLLNQYSPYFCVEGFNKDRALGIFYNSATEDVRLTLVDRNTKQVKPLILEGKQLYPVTLDRHIYEYAVVPQRAKSTLSKEPPGTLHLDKPNFVQLKPLYSPSFAENADVHARSAQIAYSWGAGQKEVNGLNQIASQLFERGHQNAEQETQRAKRAEEDAKGKLEVLHVRRDKKEEEASEAAGKLARIEALIATNKSSGWEAMRLEAERMRAYTTFTRTQSQLKRIDERIEEEDDKLSAAKTSKATAESEITQTEKGLKELHLRLLHSTESLRELDILQRDLSAFVSAAMSARGIVVSIPIAPTKEEADKYRQMIQLLNAVKGIRAEIEITKYILKYDMESSSSAEQSATAWKNYLIDNGLKIDYIVSRSFVRVDPSVRDKTELIISLPQ